MTKKFFSEEQEQAIEYLVLCGRNQGDAYRDGKNAERAVQITLDEDRALKAPQLRHRVGNNPIYIGKRIKSEAARRIRELWERQ